MGSPRRPRRTSRSGFSINKIGIEVEVRFRFGGDVEVALNTNESARTRATAGVLMKHERVPRGSVSKGTPSAGCKVWGERHRSRHEIPRRPPRYRSGSSSENRLRKRPHRTRRQPGPREQAGCTSEDTVMRRKRSTSRGSTLPELKKSTGTDSRRKPRTHC